MGKNDTRDQRLITDLMSDDFQVVTTQDNVDFSGRVVVLLDEQGGPAGVIASDGPGPVLVVSAKTLVVAILDSVDVMDALADGAPGVIVVGDGPGPVGFVPESVLRTEMSRALAAPHQLGDAEHPGDRGVFPPAVRVRCARCGGTNVFARFSQSRTIRCQHGDHDVVPDYGQH